MQLKAEAMYCCNSVRGVTRAIQSVDHKSEVKIELET